MSIDAELRKKTMENNTIYMLKQNITDTKKSSAPKYLTMI